MDDTNKIRCIRKMKRILLLVLLMTCITKSTWCLESNLTMPEAAIISSQEDSEQELSSQLQEIDDGDLRPSSGGWTSWSRWSGCSRSCDGGVSHQLRSCMRTGSCRGEHIRYKICNMQAVVLFAVLAAANAGVLLAPSAKILQGPSSRTTVVGPDGSAISSVAPGGRIITEQHPGVIGYTAPVVAAAPVAVAHAAPLAYAAPLGYAAHGVVAHRALDTLVAGPSGTIATSRTLAAPALYARHAVAAPLAYAHHGLYL